MDPRATEVVDAQVSFGGIFFLQNFNAKSFFIYC
ncbi:unnamed protein product [Onchocerca flexuosa]|uniref:Uncharacterized protein n=1 Tax=Onchocerca flexuosa TaxID=387005 RepID=A0A183HSS7_9BILA|nr:unnamed protein product [Onchocerca flexuosa]